MSKILVLLLASISVSCSSLSPSGSVDPTGRTGRPPCDDPVVIAQIIEVANTHPDFSPSMPSLALSLDNVRETRALEVEDFDSNTFQRLCVGEMALQSGETIDIGWEIFTTNTGLGPTYGLLACFGPYDPRGLDCSAFERGKFPGEIESTRTPQDSS